MVFNATERIYVNADRSAVVAEDSPDAAFLLVAEGGQLSDDEAAKYGLDKRTSKAENTADETDTEEKAASPSANKARTRADDK